MTGRMPRPNSLARTLAAAARSTLRRYPSHFAESLREKRARDASGGSVPAVAPPPVPVIEVPPMPLAARLAAAWMGHASVLLRLGGQRGITILTDPVFSDRIGMRVGSRTVGVRRMAPAPVLTPQPIDIVLISHAHFDHLDRPTLERLASPDTIVVTAKGTRRLIPLAPGRSRSRSPRFARVIELDWHESVDIRGITITAYKPRHWGARTLLDRHRGYNAYVLETKRERVLFAGDTAFTRAFDRIAADLAIFGIGAYDPWEHAHATPEQVWEMFTSMRASVLLPMHHSTFQLGDDLPGESMHRLLAAAGPHNAARVLRLPPGEVAEILGPPPQP